MRFNAIVALQKVFLFSIDKRLSRGPYVDMKPVKMRFIFISKV